MGRPFLLAKPRRRKFAPSCRSTQRVLGVFESLERRCLLSRGPLAALDRDTIEPAMQIEPTAAAFAEFSSTDSLTEGTIPSLDGSEVGAGKLMPSRSSTESVAFDSPASLVDSAVNQIVRVEEPVATHSFDSLSPSAEKTLVDIVDTRTAEQIQNSRAEPGSLVSSRDGDVDATLTLKPSLSNISAIRFGVTESVMPSTLHRLTKLAIEPNHFDAGRIEAVDDLRNDVSPADESDHATADRDENGQEPERIASPGAAAATATDTKSLKEQQHAESRIAVAMWRTSGSFDGLDDGATTSFAGAEHIPTADLDVIQSGGNASFAPGVATLNTESQGSEPTSRDGRPAMQNQPHTAWGATSKFATSENATDPTDVSQSSERPLVAGAVLTVTLGQPLSRLAGYDGWSNDHAREPNGSTRTVRSTSGERRRRRWRRRRADTAEELPTTAHGILPERKPDIKQPLSVSTPMPTSAYEGSDVDRSLRDAALLAALEEFQNVPDSAHVTNSLGGSSSASSSDEDASPSTLGAIAAAEIITWLAIERIRQRRERRSIRPPAPAYCGTTFPSPD